MIKKIATVLVLAIPLMGAQCQTTKVNVQTKIVFIEPPAALLNCPQIKRSDIPNPETATNQQIAVFINLLVKYNKVCGINMQQVKNYIEGYKKGFKQ